MGNLMIQYCQDCGKRILPEDFLSGAAVTVNNLNYCGKCKANLPPELQQQLEKTQVKKKPEPQIPTQAKAVRQPRYVPTEKEHAGKSDGAKMIWLAGAVALLIILAVVVAVRPSKGADGKSEKAERQSSSPQDQGQRVGAGSGDSGDEAEKKRQEEAERKRLKEAQEKFASLKRRSEMLAREGEFDKALEVWQNLPEELRDASWKSQIEGEKARVAKAKKENSPETIFDNMQQRALTFYREEQYDASIAIWDNVPKQLEKSPWPEKIEIEKKRFQALKWDRMGQKSQVAGDLKAALDHYTRAIESHRELPSPYMNRASVYLFQKEMDKAISDYTQAIALSPETAPQLYRLYYYRAFALLQQQKVRDATLDLCKVIELAPDCKEGPEIAKCFEAILQRDPASPYAEKMRAYVKKYQK